MGQTALYRHFDVDGRLLYVGISLCAFTRTRQHGLSKTWFHDVTRIDIEWFQTRWQAETAEYQAIKREEPLHNKAFRFKAPAPDNPIVVFGEDMQPLSAKLPEVRPAHKRSRTRKVLSKEEMAAIRQANVEERRGRTSSSSQVP